MSLRILGVLVLCGAAALGVASAGCSSSQDQQQRDEKTREDAAKAAERAKPALQAAGREVGKAARTAAEEAQAAAEGVKEGWDRNQRPAVDLNSATEGELTELPGIGHRDARRIIADRPYRNKHELVSRGILSENDYLKIRDQITLK